MFVIIKKVFVQKKKTCLCYYHFSFVMEEFIGTFKISRYQGKEEGGPLLFKKEEKHRVEKEPFFGLDDKTWVVQTSLNSCIFVYILYCTATHCMKSTMYTKYVLYNIFK